MQNVPQAVVLNSGTPEINQLIFTVEVISEDEPSILCDEVSELVNVMKKHKAPASDDIEVELRQALSVG